MHHVEGNSRNKNRNDLHSSHVTTLSPGICDMTIKVTRFTIVVKIEVAHEMFMFAGAGEANLTTHNRIKWSRQHGV